jgi:AraC-like DNA-binding protein/ActR/RegA family two-component response regulator
MSDRTVHHASRNRAFLWVDLTRQPSASLSDSLDGAFELRRVREPLHIVSAISIHAPPFVCFEFEASGESSESETRGIESLTRVRREHPTLPVLVIAGPGSMIVALWALRLRVWDLLIKPVAHEELSQRILTLASMIPAGQNGIGDVVEAASSPLTQDIARRTSPAVAYVAAHFDRKIALEDVAELCQLSSWQFCRAFRKEHAVSFGQYLLRFRMERACERLAMPNALVKQVAYAVGFNDVSYFTRSFRREFGVCPSAYQMTARPRFESCAETCEASVG